MAQTHLLDQLHQLSQYKVVTRTLTLGPHTFVTRDYKATGRIDDMTYQKHPDLWEYLPRCFGTIELDDQIVRIVCGLRKFGAEKEYRTALLTNEIKHREFYLTKANGEYSSFSCFQIGAEVFAVVRSKNVSLILRFNHWEFDLEQYTDSRYSFGVEMARLFGIQYFNLPSENQAQIIQMLLTYTMSAEHCAPAHQHLVDYGGTQRLFPFALTCYQPSSKGLTGILPEIACQWFIAVGLDSIPIRGGRIHLYSKRDSTISLAFEHHLARHSLAIYLHINKGRIQTQHLRGLRNRLQDSIKLSIPERGLGSSYDSPTPCLSCHIGSIRHTYIKKFMCDN